MAKDLRSSDVKDLEAPASAVATDLIPVERNGRDVQLTAQMIANLGGGGGAVSSVDGRTGAVTLSDLYDAHGAAATAQANAEAASQPLDADLTDIAVGNRDALPQQWTANNATGEIVGTVANVAKTALTISMMAGQTADLWDIKDSSNVKLWQMEPGGHVIHRAHAWPSFSNQPGYQLVTEELAADGIDVFQVYSTDVVTPLFNLDSSGGIEVQLQSANSQFFVKDTGFTRTENQIGTELNHTLVLQTLEVQTSSGQTFPVHKVYNADAAVYVFRVLSLGAVVSNAHAAPADADLNNSDHATWLDDTPGATVLHIKAKDSGGTVRTASIPLT